MLHHGRTGKHANRSKAVTCFIVILLAVFGLFSVLPLVMTVSQAFKPTSELYLYPPRFFVQNPTIGNFKMLFDLMNSSWVPFTRYAFNTILISVCGTVLNIVVCSMAAFPLAKAKLRSWCIVRLVTAALMFTPSGR